MGIRDELNSMLSGDVDLKDYETQYMNKLIERQKKKKALEIAEKGLIVNEALKNKELSLFEGKVVFEEADLRSLKRLLELNLPYNPEDDVIIKTE